MGGVQQRLTGKHCWVSPVLFLAWLLIVLALYYDLNWSGLSWNHLLVFISVSTLGALLASIIVALETGRMRRTLFLSLGTIVCTSGLWLITLAVLGADGLPIRHFLHLTQTLILLIWFLTLAGGVGLLLSLWLRVPYANRFELTAFCLALGMGTLAYVILCLAFSGMVSRAVLYAFLVLASLLTFSCLYLNLRRLRQSIYPGAARMCSPLHEQPWFYLGLAACVASIAVFNLVAALAPEVEFDALCYHLAQPRLWLAYGGLLPSAIEVHENFPQSGFPVLFQMLYMLALGVGDETLAKLLHFTAGVIATCGIYSLGRRYFSCTVGALASAVFYSVPVVEWASGVAYVDLAYALFGFLAVYALVNWVVFARTQWLWVSGILAGFATGVKYNGALLIVSCFLAVLVNIVARRESWRNSWLTMVSFLIPTALAASPWLFKNLVLTGNPVFPFLNNLFQSTYWLPENPQFDRAQFGIGSELLGRLLYSLWYMHFNGVKYSGLPGPFIVAALPFALRHINRFSVIKVLLGVSAVYYVLWVWSVPILRYFTPILAILSLACAVSICEATELLGRASQIFQKGVMAFLLGLILFNHPVFGSLWFSKWVPHLRTAPLPFAVVLGLESNEQYLSRALSAYATIQFANHELPPTARVLVLGGIPDRYHLERRIVWEWSPDGSSVRVAGSVEEALSALKKGRITHVLIDRERLPPALLTLFSSDSPLVNDHFKLLFSKNNVLLYEVSQEPLNKSEYTVLDFLSKGVALAQIAPLQTWRGAEIQPPRYMTVTASGDKRGAFVQIAPSRISFDLVIPEASRLQFAVATVWNAGDGVMATIDVEQATGSDRIFEQWVRPWVPGTGTWAEYDIDLSKYRNRQVRLVFTVDPGPNGDATADWLAWADLRISRVIES